MSARPEDPGAVRDGVRARYAALATVDGGCCDPCGEAAAGDCDDEAAGPTPAAGAEAFGTARYAAEDLAGLPEAARLASLGCGNPLTVAELAEGETVLDLGSGGGIDVLLSARRVGPAGMAYGLDMTDEMLDLARRNAAAAGVDNVAFLRGEIEAIPLDEDTVDVVISNCVINLSPEKAAVFGELRRVLRPGGRVGLTDVVAEDRLSPEDRAARGSHVGCIAGALSVSEYERGLADAGFEAVEVRFTHEVADGLHGATVRAAAPA